MQGSPVRAVLISTYELGRPPFGLASPAAWLHEAGALVRCLDLAVQPLDEGAVEEADLVAIYVPMHTATRLAATLLPHIKSINSRAHLCCYGLYAPLNADYLRTLGAQTILGGEFEQGLVSLVRRLAGGSLGAQAANPPPPTQDVQVPNRHMMPDNRSGGRERNGYDRGGPNVHTIPSTAMQPEPVISLARQHFQIPVRECLPGLEQYAHLMLGNGERRTVGYTEATRGCKHLCRHCPIPPVYGGAFRVIQPEVVLEDIAWQVARGARHITFGDPDFFNGPTHGMRIVELMHQHFPDLTYDVTIKIEHLLKHARLLPTLAATGCLVVTSAVEAIDDTTLAIYDKRHTRDDFIRAVQLCRAVGLTINPTFVTFSPWTTIEGFRDLLALIRELDLVDAVAPIQYGIRLLIPAGSLLLERPEVRALVGPYDQEALAYPWKHPDPRVDRLCADVLAAVQRGQKQCKSRREIFRDAWALAQVAVGIPAPDALASLDINPLSPGAAVPHLSEPWYC